jgi:hypothetical protein
MDRRGGQAERPDLVRPKHSRDMLMISLPMSWVVMVLGFLGSVLSMIWGGLLIFVAIANYACLPNNGFLNYYTDANTNIGFGSIYIGVVGLILSGVYLIWSFFLVERRYIQILYLVSLLLGVVCLVLSLHLVTEDQLLIAIRGRSPGWYREGGATKLSDPESWQRLLKKYLQKDIARAILFIFQSVMFGWTYQSSYLEMMAGLKLEAP